jgi:hypothetical protein
MFFSRLLQDKLRDLADARLALEKESAMVEHQVHWLCRTLFGDAIGSRYSQVSNTSCSTKSFKLTERS